MLTRKSLIYKAMRVSGRPKYRNTPTNGYASKREAARANYLHALHKAGEIENLREQVRYELLPAQYDLTTGKLVERACHYVADFVYDVRVDSGLTTVVEDSKGMRTPNYILKRKLMLYMHGVRITEV